MAVVIFAGMARSYNANGVSNEFSLRIAAQMQNIHQPRQSPKVMQLLCTPKE